MYTNYGILLKIVSIILLLAKVGPIVITEPSEAIQPTLSFMALPMPKAKIIDFILAYLVKKGKSFIIKRINKFISSLSKRLTTKLVNLKTKLGVIYFASIVFTIEIIGY